jgi:phage minor structural protein
MIESRIDALDFLAQLKGELVIDYTADSDTITQIVTALLAFQVHANPITIGTIEPTVSRSLQVENDTIYSVLMGLRNTVGGYIEVDTDRHLNWYNSIGENKGQQIRYKKNIVGLHREYDFSNFANRLYAYGAGESTAKIKLSDATGYDLDYVEDTGSQTTYGLCVKRIVDKSITHPDTLKSWADLQLVEMATPLTSYTVDMVNLVAMGWTFEDLELGSYVTVIDEDLGIEISARIVKIVRDLSDPLNIQVEISNPGKDITDTLTGVYDVQQFNNATATKIGAGQVTVLGTFTVEDWVTAGTTTISGNNIRSGVLQSNNWGTSAGSYFDLVAGVFKLGGSAAPKLSWDGSTLSVTGMISVGGAAADVNTYATTISGSKITTNSLDANVIKTSSLSVALSMAVGGSLTCGPVKLDTEGAWINGTNKALIFKDGYEMGCIRYSALTNTLYIETSVYGKHISLSSAGYLYLYGAYGISTSSNIVAQNGISLAKSSYPTNSANGTLYYDSTFNILVVRKSGAWKEVLTS